MGPMFFRLWVMELSYITQFPPNPNSLLILKSIKNSLPHMVCLDCAYFCWNWNWNWNWKHCSEIIFKCINSVVGPTFNKKVAEKCNLWNPWTMHGCTVHSWQSQLCRLKKKKKREKRRGETQTPESLQSKRALSLEIYQNLCTLEWI